jgi:serine/threonine-protein kinase RsbW
MESSKLVITNSMEELQKVQTFIDGLADEWVLKPEMRFNLNLILEEYISNLVNYGYHDAGEHTISIEVFREGSQVRVEVIDDAGPFDITETPDNEDVDKSLEERKIGGLGIHFIKTLADDLDYQTGTAWNRLTFIKRL